MKPLLINTYDRGGAANSCIRLHDGLLAQKVQSTLLLKNKSLGIKEAVVFNPKLTFQDKLSHKIKRILIKLKLAKEDKLWRETAFKHSRPKGLESFSFPYSDTDIHQSTHYQTSDIINLHWVAGLLDFPTFFNKNKKPIVWTLHDQNPFLGGEHYAERFLGIDENGYPIPRKYTPAELLEEKRLLKIKQKALQGVQNIHIVSPSRWLLESSQNSALFSKFPHYHIPYGYPTHIFKPYNMTFCRDVLGIPHDKKVLLFVADSVDNSRKGYVFLQKALDKLSESYQNQVVLCAIGSKASLSTDKQVIELGRINDERLMAMAYSAADVFVIPSLEDNLPNTMLESLLCGTPVIGFQNGGIPDVVINQKTGYLCPEISVQSLTETIEKFLDNTVIFDREKIANDTAKNTP